MSPVSVILKARRAFDATNMMVSASAERVMEDEGAMNVSQTIMEILDYNASVSKLLTGIGIFRNRVRGYGKVRTNK